MLILQILVLVLLVSVGAMYSMYFKLENRVNSLEEEIWDMWNDFYDLEERLTKKKK